MKITKIRIERTECYFHYPDAPTEITTITPKEVRFVSKPAYHGRGGIQKPMLEPVDIRIPVGKPDRAEWFDTIAARTEELLGSETLYEALDGPTIELKVTYEDKHTERISCGSDEVIRPIMELVPMPGIFRFTVFPH